MNLKINSNVKNIVVYIPKTRELIFLREAQHIPETNKLYIPKNVDFHIPETLFYIFLV